MLTRPVPTVAELRDLGVSTVRLMLRWQEVAPSPNSFKRPAGFNASNPAAYPAAVWKPFDTAIKDAQAAGIGIDLDLLGGAPLWATGPGMPPRKLHPPNGYPFHNWEPSASPVRRVRPRCRGPLRRQLRPGHEDRLTRQRGRSSEDQLLVDLERARLRPEPRAAGTPGPSRRRGFAPHGPAADRRGVDVIAPDRPWLGHDHLRRDHPARRHLQHDRLRGVQRHVAVAVPARDVLRELQATSSSAAPRLRSGAARRRRPPRRASPHRTRRCSRPAASRTTPIRTAWHPTVS